MSVYRVLPKKASRAGSWLTMVSKELMCHFLANWWYRGTCLFVSEKCRKLTLRLLEVTTFATNDAVHEGCLCTKFHGKCLVCLTPLRKSYRHIA